MTFIPYEKRAVLKAKIDGRTSYSQLEDLFDARIDTACNKIYIENENGEYEFYLSFRSKEDCIQKLKMSDEVNFGVRDDFDYWE